MIKQQEKILFDKFEILQCIKKDSYSCVYIATHIYLGKTIFLKTLARDKISDPVILHRFQREARSLAGINHQNIIQVYDFGNYKNHFYISFEYFPSTDLRTRINGKKMADQDKLSIFTQIIQGLAEAHQHNIIHRDIKPENILVNEHNHVKIADFGLALIRDDLNQTRQESIVGTPGYMSPEQIMGDNLTPASDLFSLGILGYELFTGKNPFLGQDAGATINKILACDIFEQLEAEAAFPVEIINILKQLLQKNKAKRPANAGKLLDMFHLDNNLSANVPVTVIKQKKRSKFWAIGILPVLILGIISFIFIQKNNKHTDTLPTIQQQTEIAADTQHTTPNLKNNNASLNNVNIERPDNLPIQSEQHELTNNNGALISDLDLPGKLYVQCLPWADVYIDNQKIETTPLEGHINILAGSHELVLQHPDYPPYTKELTIKPGEETIISVNLDTLVGYLFCRVYPWGNVYVDSVFRGQTPLQKPVCLMAGKHLLTLNNNNFGKIDEYIQINKMDTLEFKFNFERLVTRKDSTP